MTTESKRRRVAEALTVRWTPALAARVERRIGEAIGRRRRRRRIAIVGLAFLLVGGASFAFTRTRDLFRRKAAMAAHASRPPRAAPEAQAAPEPSMPPATSAAPGSAAPGHPADLGAAPEARPAQTPHRRLATSAPVRPPVATPAESVASLFAAADAARLAGRPADAVAPLTAIFTRFPADSRAAIAAFQLGRVLADELHDPPAAARAFERARYLAPGGPLAKDAATRAAEAHRAVQPAGGATP